MWNRKRQDDRDTHAACGRVAGAYLPAVCFDDILADRQA
jgi:hypothetical protein